MRVRAGIRTLTQRALCESMDVKTMVHLVRRLLPNYDPYERTGFPLSVPIPNRTAARQIVDDVASLDLFLDFVALMIDVERLGMGGRKYRFPRLAAITNGILETGYRYEADSRRFVEDCTIRTTRNWGVLKDGEIYVMAFLGVDVADNSGLVKRYGNGTMREVYSRIRLLAAACAEKRNGRLWGWEGDGGILAFTSDEQNQRATLTGMEILNELFLYNLAECAIDGGLHVRLTAHNGPCRYSEDGSELKSDTVKRLWDIDSRHGRPGTLVVSDSVYPSLDRQVAAELVPVPVSRDQNHYAYSVRLG